MSEMAENGGKNWWTKQRVQAAQLVAQGDLTQAEIAEKLKVGQRSIERWCADPQFQARVASIVEETAQQIKAQGIRLKENRVKNLQARVDKMLELIEKRGAEMGKNPAEVEIGGATGLLVRAYDRFGNLIYKFDAALLREMREHERQAAVELGQWTEKQDIGLTGNIIPEIHVYAHEHEPKTGQA